MGKRKKVRTRGKVQLSRYFQELKEGDRVSIVREPSIKSSFPKRLQGKTGIIKGRRGKACITVIKDQNKEKTFPSYYYNWTGYFTLYLLS